MDLQPATGCSGMRSETQSAATTAADCVGSAGSVHSTRTRGDGPVAIRHRVRAAQSRS